MAQARQAASLALVDAHVHIYGCFSLPEFLDSARHNFEAEAERRGRGEDFTGMLLLTETSQEDWFGTLRGEIAVEGPGAAAPWRVEATGENESLRLAHRESPEQGLLMLAGRQIVTSENLEVLALATTRRFADGAPLAETVEAVRLADAIPVIPWGFGKWLGPRGALLQRFLEGDCPGGVFLGDNGGRPVFWGRPRHFAWADGRGLPVLPGSDPLPFASEGWRPGSTGFALSARIGTETPAADLRSALLDPDVSAEPYGRQESPHRFLRNQLAMQLAKRRRSGP